MAFAMQGGNARYSLGHGTERPKNRKRKSKLALLGELYDLKRQNREDRLKAARAVGAVKAQAEALRAELNKPWTRKLADWARRTMGRVTGRGRQ